MRFSRAAVRVPAFSPRGQCGQEAGLIRRLASVGAGGALVLGSLGIGPPAAHAAAPFPAGQTTINFTAALTIQAAGNPATINFTGSMTGTSDGAGHLSFPKAHISFSPATVNIIVTGVVVHASATTAFTGTLNTTTRVMTR